MAGNFEVVTDQTGVPILSRLSQFQWLIARSWLVLTLIVVCVTSQPACAQIPTSGNLTSSQAVGLASQLAAQAGDTLTIKSEGQCCRKTIWDFLGIDQVFGFVGDVFTGILNVPLVKNLDTAIIKPGLQLVGLTNAPSGLPLPAGGTPGAIPGGGAAPGGTGNLTQPPGASKVAQKVAADQALAEATIAAIRYLATLDCHCYPEVVTALLAELDSCIEAVRFEAIHALEAKCQETSCSKYRRPRFFFHKKHAKHSDCVTECFNCACQENVVKRLSDLLLDKNSQGYPKEGSKRVRMITERILKMCVQERSDPLQPEPDPHFRPEPDPTVGDFFSPLPEQVPTPAGLIIPELWRRMRSISPTRIPGLPDHNHEISLEQQTSVAWRIRRSIWPHGPTPALATPTIRAQNTDAVPFRRMPDFKEQTQNNNKSRRVDSTIRKLSALTASHKNKAGESDLLVIQSLSGSLIQITRDEPEFRMAFEKGVQHYFNATSQLAKTNKELQTKLLEQLVDFVLEQAMPSSIATDMALRVSQLLSDKITSDDFHPSDRDLLIRHTHRVRHCVQQFPESHTEFSPLVLMAGQRCGEFGLVDEARECYLLVIDKSPGSKECDTAHGCLKKLDDRNARTDERDAQIKDDSKSKWRPHNTAVREDKDDLVQMSIDEISNVFTSEHAVHVEVDSEAAGQHEMQSVDPLDSLASNPDGDLEITIDIESSSPIDKDVAAEDSPVTASLDNFAGKAVEHIASEKSVDDDSDVYEPHFSSTPLPNNVIDQMTKAISSNGELGIFPKREHLLRFKTAYETAGTAQMPFAPFVIDYARPTTIMRLRYDSYFNYSAPDRSEYLWAEIGGRGPTSPEASINFQELRLYSETGSKKASAIFEFPIRFLDPATNGNTSGPGDLVLGAKTVIKDQPDFQFSSIFKTHMNLGSAKRGLGTGHLSLEPGVLFNWRVGCNSWAHGELKVLFPLGGGLNASGQVLRTGLGFSTVLLGKPLYSSAADDQRALIGTVEFENINFLDGNATLASGAIANAEQSLTNAHFGMRLIIDKNMDLGVSIGIPITQETTYQNLLRTEFRWRF